MDTEEKYLDDEIYVVMAGETPPEKIKKVRQENHKKRVEDDDDPLVGPPELEWDGLRDHKPLGEQPKIDGQVTFYDPELLDDGEPFEHYTFPFRSKDKDGLWFCYPDRDKWERSPIWKWQNPDEDPHENLTLNPSIGVGQPLKFHCYIRNGEIDWL